MVFTYRYSVFQVRYVLQFKFWVLQLNSTNSHYSINDCFAHCKDSCHTHTHTEHLEHLVSLILKYYSKAYWKETWSVRPELYLFWVLRRTVILMLSFTYKEVHLRKVENKSGKGALKYFPLTLEVSVMSQNFKWLYSSRMTWELALYLYLVWSAGQRGTFISCHLALKKCHNFPFSFYLHSIKSTQHNQIFFKIFLLSCSLQNAMKWECYIFSKVLS